MSVFNFYKTFTSGFGICKKTAGLIKSNSFFGFVCSKLGLINFRIKTEHGFKKHCSDSFSLIFRKYKNILNKKNGISIADGTDYSNKFVSVMSTKNF